MRAVVQRVSRGSVRVGEAQVAAIGPGLVVLLGVRRGDADRDARALAEKIAHLRVFADDEGKMNRSLLEVGGQVLSVPQFTLYGDVRKGRRPSFVDAAPPEEADGLYRAFNAALADLHVRVEAGLFRARMEVEIHNDGPVTIVLDTDAL